MTGTESFNTDEKTRRLPLHDEHTAQGARFFEFGRWLMPVSYSSIIEEHLHVRRHAGLFDVSHMGRLFLRGTEALETISRLVATDVSRLDVGRAQYTALLSPEGGIKDDLIVYRREDGVLLIVNAANLDGDFEWIGEHLLPGVELDDLSSLTCLLAFQGPEALGLLSSFTDLDVQSMNPFTLAEAAVADRECTVMRTGYTGERGVEILTMCGDAREIWTTLLGAGSPGTVRPIGLGARDMLRLEAGLLLYGQDIDLDTTPFEASLDRLVSLDRPVFVGREALLEAARVGPRKKLVGITTEARNIARHGDSVVADGKTIGVVTSGSYSPVLEHPIALASVLPEYAEVGREVALVVREKEIPATIVKLPFFKSGVTAMPPETGPAGNGEAA